MTTTIEAWQNHQPVWAPPPSGQHYRGRSIGSCTGCGWTPKPKEDPSTSYAKHLAELGAPDYMVEYWSFWAGIVEGPDGAVSRDAVARELFDFKVVMGEASKVYEELTGLSKPNTAAHHVIAAAEETFAARYADYLCDLADGEERPDVQAALIAIANDWHEGAWDEYRAGKAQAEARVAR
jgi:hypothetical protein